MTSIFDEVAHDLGHAAHTIETDIASMFGHGEYHAPSSPAPAPDGDHPMSLTSDITDAEDIITKAHDDAQAAIGKVHDDAQAAISKARDFAAHLEANPVFTELLLIADDTPQVVLQQLAVMIGPMLASLTAAHNAVPAAPVA